MAKFTLENIGQIVIQRDCLSVTCWSVSLPLNIDDYISMLWNMNCINLSMPQVQNDRN